jgi:hydroxyacylglutathione hydrolase
VGRPDLLESAAGQVGAMEPSARTLYSSLRATAALPEHLQILPAHGAGSACGKALGAIPFSVLGYERRFNGALREALEGTEDAFVKDILTGQPEPPLYFARMKRDNKLGPALLPDGKLPQPRRLSAGELTASVLDNKKHVILDLRHDRAAFMERHLAGSLFAPLQGGKLPLVAGSYVDENAAIILVVNDSSEVDEAVRQLVRIGLDKVESWIPADEALSGHFENNDLTASTTRITTAELAGALAAHPAAAVLDVRSTGEYAESHVRGSKHIPYTRLAARLAEVPQTHPLYVHCGSGLRASFAVAFLAHEGREVILVDGAFGKISPELQSKHSTLEFVI